MAAIRVQQLCFAYPDGRVALDSVEIEVGRGERVALLGPNGAGKTTLALHLNGVLRAARGEVVVDGLTLDDATVREIRRRVGIVFQDPDDQLFMPRVWDDVAFGPANYGVEGAALVERVDAALAAVGMEGEATRVPHHLSFGQKRRVAIATVLAMEPSILVLDEPSSNLDPRSRRELAELLGGFGHTMLIVTHDLLFAAELCERAVILDEGRIVADGPAITILHDATLLDAHRLELPRTMELRR
jgi:cobalt/nickel transport system ATP-binding protein